MIAGRGGWSEWQQPIMKGYMMQCCDCGLVHEIQFKALEQISEPDTNGDWKARLIKKGRVDFRARRYRPKK
jgi:hypothetical protein